MTFSHCDLKFSHRTVFENFHFELVPGKWTCLLGQSGIGKSSLLKIIAKLIEPDSIKINTSLDISYLPQQDCLMPWLSVLDNVVIGKILRNQPRDAQTKAKALSLLKRVGLDGTAKLKPHELSGGMRQRVALVRTLMEDKPVILMDEPFSSLDIPTRLELHDLTTELLEGKTVLLVTHDPLDAIGLAHRVHIMAGSPAQLSEPFLFDTPKPRNWKDKSVVEQYIKLLQALCHSAVSQETTFKFSIDNEHSHP